MRLPDWVEWGARGEGIAALWVELGTSVGVLHTCRIHFKANDPSTSNFVCFWVLVVVILENQAKVIIDVWYLHTNVITTAPIPPRTYPRLCVPLGLVTQVCQVTTHETNQETTLVRIPNKYTLRDRRRTR